MAASAVQNPAAPADSKSAKKKKAKAGRTESPAPAASEKAVSVAPNEANGDDSGEPAYLRELSKCVPDPSNFHIEDFCASDLNGPKAHSNAC